MASFLESSRRVEFCETDMAGIVHFSNFYRWMEQVEHDFFRSLGLTIVNHQPDGSVIGWPRVSATCRYESPARYEEIIDVKLTVQRIGVKSITFDVRFTRDGAPVANGSMKTVCCVMEHDKAFRSVEIPEQYLTMIQEYQPAR